MDNEPFSPRPSLCQGDLDSVLSKHLGTGCSEITLLVIVQQRWHLGVTAE